MSKTAECSERFLKRLSHGPPVASRCEAVTEHALRCCIKTGVATFMSAMPAGRLLISLLSNENLVDMLIISKQNPTFIPAAAFAAAAVM